ncbi:hypothetical protein GCK72_021553 [Caenorhabditis remanei]|uniref:Uncharacterized protein n=1 Tax=Caenorhabditis remanei TaxID=31234 RepID=A0A6A5GIH0_CAERE|nr:hypothetical protein GCK72_021553 [Caenorhabditis remanei]KAF1754987.1 hypothetical protein GCK72_021553 [Caenorhabditis remanei]
MTISQLDYSNPLCLVCGNDGNGVHFGVQTCRACAMFFRRSTTQKIPFYCKKHPKFCDIHVAEHRLMCKYCRLKKCQEVGMSREKKLPPRPQGIGCDHELSRNRYGSRVIYDVIDPDTGVVSRLIDVAPIIKRSRLILENHSLPEAVSTMNPLEKMTFALNKIRSDQNLNPEMIKSSSFRDYFYFWEQNMRKCAEWLMYSEEFRMLPKHERVCMFGEEINQYYQDLVKPYLKLNLSEIEVTFILCQLVWNYAGRRLQGQTQTAGEIFLEKISNNLNDYYRSIDRDIIGNYAGRLTRMMSIVNNVLTLQLKQEKLMDMVFLFDMFNFKFSDPAFFSV